MLEIQLLQMTQLEPVQSQDYEDFADTMSVDVFAAV